MHAVEAIDLTKRFGGRAAVDSLSLSVPSHAILGFLGANGAGKTTTLRLILGLLRPDHGQIRLFGQDVTRARFRRHVGALIESPSLYPHLSGAENLDLTRRLLGAPSNEVDRVLRLVDLSGAGRHRVAGYSLGMRQRLAIARALIGRPRLLILDEPTNGLDPDGIADMRGLLRRLPAQEDTTLIVSSHLLTEVEEVATHVALMHRGRLLVNAPIETLLGGDEAVEADIAEPGSGRTLLEKAGYRVEAAAQRLVIRAGEGTASVRPDAVARLLVSGGHDLRYLARHRPTLEHAYHRAIARAAA